MNYTPHIMSLKQSSEYLGVSEKTLKRRIESKLLKAYKDGGCWKIKKEWADEYQQNLIRKHV